MTFARADSSGEAHARTELCNIQFRELFIRCVPNQERLRAKLEVLLEENLVRRLAVFGTDQTGEVVVSLALECDHNIQHLELKATPEVEIDLRQWKDLIAPEMEAAIPSFNKVVLKRKLTVRSTVQLIGKAKAERLKDAIGLTPCTLQRNRPRQVKKMTISELKELALFFEFSEVE